MTEKKTLKCWGRVSKT